MRGSSMSASQNLYCPQCGKAVREDDSVCPDCQKELSGLKARVLNAHHKADDQDHPHRFLRGPLLRTSYAGLAVALGFWFQLLPAAVVLLRNKAALLELRRQADMVMEVLSGLSKGRIPDPSAFPAILSSAPAAYVRLVSDQFTSGLVAAGGVGTALLLLFALWRLFEKAGMGGWKCLVPFYNAYCLLKLAEISGWSMLLPFLGMIYSVYVQVDTLLLIFLIWLALAIIRFLYRLNL